MIIKNNSLQYDEAIRKNKKLELQKKEQIVKEIKQEKQQFKESLMNSRLVEYLSFYIGNKRKKWHFSTQLLQRYNDSPL